MSQRSIQRKTAVLADIRVGDSEPGTIKRGDAVSINRAADAFFARRGIVHPTLNRPRRSPAEGSK